MASIGLPEAEARAAAGTIRVLRWPFSENAAARAAEETEGFVKAVVDRKGRILGVTIVGMSLLLGKKLGAIFRV